ncbi:SHOCT-like domain-containing protein [Methanosarcina barkeri]
MKLSGNKQDEPFITFIKGLAVDSKIELETAKLIIEKYNSEKRDK